jgi:hypothetical protein
MQLEYKKGFYSKLSEKHNINSDVLGQLRNKSATFTSGAILHTKNSISDTSYTPSSIANAIKRLNKYNNLFTK